MKILHLANWNSTNIGNGALIFGTERVLREDMGGELTFIPEAWDDYTFGLKRFDASFVEKVNTTADALLVNGAVTMNAFRRFTKETGMRFDLPLVLWDEIKKPIIFYGISYRCWPFQEYPNKDALRRTFEYMIGRNDIFFGVRNDGTKQWIERTLGLKSTKIVEVPDPGIFVPHANGETYPELHPQRKNIIISFNNEDAVYRFATTIECRLWKPLLRIFSQPQLERIFTGLGFFKIKRHKLVQNLAKSVEEIAAIRDDVQFILCPHYLDDYGMIQEFIEVVNERVAHQLTVSTGLLKVEHTKLFYGRYKQVSAAISMRVHSMSPSIGLGVPVVPLVSQGRMRNFLSNAGLSDIAVDITNPDMSDELTKKVLELLENPQLLLDKTNIAVKTMRHQIKEINKQILLLLKNK